jgi:hypothetical protein
MIKAKCTEPDGTATFILGLSFANLDRLRAGHPIQFDGTPYGYDGKILLFSGPDEKFMTEFLLGTSQIDENTKTFIERNVL